MDDYSDETLVYLLDPTLDANERSSKIDEVFEAKAPAKYRKRDIQLQNMKELVRSVCLMPGRLRWGLTCYCKLKHASSAVCQTDNSLLQYVAEDLIAPSQVEA